jgi:hypothetical protein
MMHLKFLEKQVKPQISRWKERKKFRAEINAIETPKKYTKNH